jgi:hypothetical protein
MRCRGVFMGTNIMIGFIIPWAIALIVVRERKILYYIAPFASVLSFIVNTLGFHYLWNLYPFEFTNLSGLPFDIGLFCLYPCISIYIIKKYDINIYIGLPIASLAMILIEGCGLLAGRIVYYNHWNIIGTYFSYLIPLIICYIFYKFLKKQNLV